VPLCQAEGVGVIPWSALARSRLLYSASIAAPIAESIHMEDFAQGFGLYPEAKYHHCSYANIAAVLWAETEEAGTYEFFRQLVFSVLIGNADMISRTGPCWIPTGEHLSCRLPMTLLQRFRTFPRTVSRSSSAAGGTLNEITTDQLRRFADTARLPAVAYGTGHRGAHRGRVEKACRKRPAPRNYAQGHRRSHHDSHQECGAGRHQNS
jgi:hypothetical protein